MGQFCQRYYCHHQLPQITICYVKALVCQAGQGSHANFKDGWLGLVTMLMVAGRPQNTAGIRLAGEEKQSDWTNVSQTVDCIGNPAAHPSSLARPVRGPFTVAAVVSPLATRHTAGDWMLRL